MKKIRWGIIGAGRISHTFAKDMPATANGVVQAVASRDGTSAQEFAAQYGIPTAHHGYDALYADPNVDAVYVATPHTYHLTNSAAALGAGKAVLCEKPITVNPDECRQLMDASEANSAFLMEAMWTWFLPAIRKARQWVKAGRIGRIVRIHSDFGYPFPYDPDLREYNADLAGGCLLEMGVYPVALTLLFADADPVGIFVVSRHAPNGVEDDVAAILKFENCVATLATSFRAKLQNWAYIIGEEGYIAIPDFWCARECQLWVMHDKVDTYNDERTTHGFNFQIDAVNGDLAAGRRQSKIMSQAASLQIQTVMDEMRTKF